MLIDFKEKVREEEIEAKKHQCGRETLIVASYICPMPQPEPNPQPRNVSHLGIKPGTFLFMGQQSNQLSHTSQEWDYFLKKQYAFIYSGHERIRAIEEEFIGY